MSRVRLVSSEKGFTLIEIIAVLIILGILAAVAVPKFVNIQSDSQMKSLDGAMAALQAVAVQDYSYRLLKGSADSRNYAPSNNISGAGAVNLGDFNGTISAADSDGNVTLTLESGPGTWFNNAPTANKTKIIKIF
jgi:prepilin-type N-terminal cleavage/methylation domain-containing protein